MWIGPASLTERYYQTAQYGPVTPVERVASVSGNARQFGVAASASSAGQSLAPLNAETAQSTMIYSSNRLRVNENSFDDAPLTKNAAHMKARARMAMNGSPSQRGNTAMKLQTKAAPKKEAADEIGKNEQKLSFKEHTKEFSVANMAELVGNLGNFIDIYA